MSSVSRTNVSQRSTSCSRRIFSAWSSFSRTSVSPDDMARDATRGAISARRRARARSSRGSGPSARGAHGGDEGALRGPRRTGRATGRRRETRADCARARRRRRPALCHEFPKRREIRVLAEVRRIENRLAVALAEVPRPRLLEDRRHVRAAVGTQDAPDLREIGVLVGYVLHDHRRDDRVERAVLDLGYGVGGRHDRPDPGESGGDVGEPRRPRGRRRTPAASRRCTPRAQAPRSAGRRRSRGRRARAGRAEANAPAAQAGARRRSGRRSPYSARSRGRRYVSLQSPVSPSQQPILNRHRGH